MLFRRLFHLNLVAFSEICYLGLFICQLVLNLVYFAFRFIQLLEQLVSIGLHSLKHVL